MSDTDPKRLAIGKALGRVPSGVFILTAHHDGTHAAMMASWVQQISFSPPMISVAVAPDRPIASLIRDSERLAVSVLGVTDTPLMKKYARGIPPGEDPFSGIETLAVTGGVRVLGESLAYLDCRLAKIVETNGDHLIVLATIEAGELLKEGNSFTHLRGSGFHY